MTVLPRRAFELRLGRSVAFGGGEMLNGVTNSAMEGPTAVHGRCQKHVADLINLVSFMQGNLNC